MHKSIANLICAFIPVKKTRDNLRRKLLPARVNYNFIVQGKNNKLIQIDEQGNEEIMTTNIPGMKINVKGDNNTIKIHLPLNPQNTFIEIANNNAFCEVGPSQGDFNVHIAMVSGTEQKCIIGKNTTLGGVFIALTEKSQCMIGEDCMLSGMIRIYCADGHSILDVKTDKVLNTASKPLIIGNHVWIGEGARLTKNAHIYDNSIIAGGAVACKDYKEPNVIIAGNPGTIIKRGITWSRLNPYHIEQKN